MENTSTDLPEAITHMGYNGMYVVDKCPYCDRMHVHSKGPSDDNMQRLSACFKGEYILKLTSK